MCPLFWGGFFLVPRVGLAIVVLAPGLGLVLGVVAPGPRRKQGLGLGLGVLTPVPEGGHVPPSWGVQVPKAGLTWVM